MKIETNNNIIKIDFEINCFNTLYSATPTIASKKKLLDSIFYVDVVKDDIKSIYNEILERETAFYSLIYDKFNFLYRKNKKYLIKDNEYDFLNQKINWFSNDLDEINKIRENKTSENKLFTIEPNFDFCNAFEFIVNVFKEKRVIQNYFKTNNQHLLIDLNFNLSDEFSLSIKRLMNYLNHCEFLKAQDLINETLNQFKVEIESIKQFKDYKFLFKDSIDLKYKELDSKYLDKFYETFVDKNILEININNFISSLNTIKTELIDNLISEEIKFNKFYPEIPRLRLIINEINTFLYNKGVNTYKDISPNHPQKIDLAELGKKILSLCDLYATLFKIKEFNIGKKRHTTTNYENFPVILNINELTLISDINVVMGLVSKSIDVKINQLKKIDTTHNFDVLFETGSIFIYTKLVKCLDGLRYFYNYEIQ